MQVPARIKLSKAEPGKVGEGLKFQMNGLSNRFKM
jgi:hypothetical protein